MSSLGGQAEEPVPGYATEIGAATYRAPVPQRLYERDQLAHWFVRVASGLTDVAVIGWPVAIPYETMSEGHHKATMIANGLIVTFVLTALVAVWEGRTGRSPGKALLRLRLVDAGGGQPLGVWRAIGRRLAHLLDGLSCYLGYLWPLWDEQRQTFADKITDAVVVARETKAA